MSASRTAPSVASRQRLASGLVAGAASALTAPASAEAPPDPLDATPAVPTLGELARDWIGYVHTASELLILMASVLGLALVARSILRVATTEEGDGRWRHVWAGAVGATMCFVGVTLGALSRLFVPG